jgi:uncharacterized membrane protein YoaK (UPF0700 family)
LILDTSRFL